MTTIAFDGRREFFEHHRGGRNVIMVIVSDPGGSFPLRFAIFSSIELAEKWADETLSDDHAVCFAPFVVDEPDFGNAVKQ